MFNTLSPWHYCASHNPTPGGCLIVSNYSCLQWNLVCSTSSEACLAINSNKSFELFPFFSLCLNSFYYTILLYSSGPNCSDVQSAHKQISRHDNISSHSFSSYAGNKFAVWNISRQLPKRRCSLLGSDPRTCYNISDKAHPSASAWHRGSGKLLFVSNQQTTGSLIFRSTSPLV